MRRTTMMAAASLAAAFLLGLGGVTALAQVPNAASSVGDCTHVIAANDTVGGNTAGRTFFGRAVGQTFYAADTLISRITVWRHPNNRHSGGDRLFVTTVDTVNYVPSRPITTGILQNGPAVFVVDSDPPGLPIPMDFILDPPLALPHPGTYAFFIQRVGCDAGETAILAKEPGTYPYGTYWITGRTIFLPCYLASAEWWVDIDLCFEMEFCRDTATPVRGDSWGRLKVIYR
ncbi:MAG: hypothetical protein E6K81_15700 [Candidatus Eisenbacteria bacterium]|uniref:Uncharacterized protein n=1 Tax=Eiseniibacteriota bacterium TaxID=2212470 RepID=A0A538U008_UNCEI|nr:MAG: hypothetical protein E6K81_15700 [Candidatus Eisenbacteria bacterium]